MEQLCNVLRVCEAFVTTIILKRKKKLLCFLKSNVKGSIALCIEFESILCRKKLHETDRLCLFFVMLLLHSGDLSFVSLGRIPSAINSLQCVLLLPSSVIISLCTCNSSHTVISQV